MAPRVKKPITLAQIRAEGIAFRAAAMPAAKGSAFHALTEKNNAFLNCTTRKDEYNEKRTSQALTRAKKRKKAKKQQVAPEPSAICTPPVPPVIESWQTAAGSMVVDNSTIPTPFLGIARVPTWCEEQFKDALRTLLDTVGGSEQFSTICHEAGGEYYSEITARFLDEKIAAEVLEKINGSVCLGRKLHIAFAPEF